MSSWNEDREDVVWLSHPFVGNSAWPGTSEISAEKSLKKDDEIEI